MTTALDPRPRLARRSDPPSSRPDELAEIGRLWDEQKRYAADHPAVGAYMDYLESHFGLGITVRRHLRVLDLIQKHIRGRVLEWGCHHALDSCVYRMRLGSAVELHGCDVVAEDAYRPFHQDCGLSYTRLHHPWQLPYPDAHFDVVTSNGVLEHVPDDAASLREIARILRPAGTFVLTCLPNRWSYTEAFQRHRGQVAHDRLYTLGQARRMLEAVGLRVREARYLFVLPTMLHGIPRPIRRAYQTSHRVVRPINNLLERIPPINRLASNLMLVAERS